jgi:hypothetical protein
MTRGLLRTQKLGVLMLPSSPGQPPRGGSPAASVYSMIGEVVSTPHRVRGRLSPIEAQI